MEPSGEDQVQTHQDNKTRRGARRAKRDGEAPSFPQLLPSIYQVPCRCRHPARQRASQQESRGSAEGAQRHGSLCVLHLLALSAARKALSRETRAEQRGPSLLCRSALALPAPLPAVLRCTYRAPASHTAEEGLMHPLRAAGERAQGVDAQEAAANARCRGVAAKCCAPAALSTRLCCVRLARSGRFFALHTEEESGK